MADTLEELLAITPPERHMILRIGPLQYYWIWINKGTEHQRRTWTLSWRTRRRMLHLMQPEWWRPFKMFPSALLASLEITAKRS